MKSIGYFIQQLFLKPIFFPPPWPFPACLAFPTWLARQRAHLRHDSILFITCQFFVCVVCACECIVTTYLNDYRADFQLPPPPYIYIYNVCVLDMTFLTIGGIKSENKGKERLVGCCLVHHSFFFIQHIC